MSEAKRSNRIISHEVNDDNVRFNVQGFEPLVLVLEELSEKVKQRAMVHGIVQRICDAAAKSCDPDSGKPASAEEKYLAMKKLVEHYSSGTEDWGLKGERGESGGILARAIANVMQKDLKVVKEFLKSRSPAERKALERSSEIRREIDRLTESTVKSIDAEELLSGL